MSETPSHRRAKARAAGLDGQNEVPLSRGRRLDALSPSGARATEIERSGSRPMLEKAARRLKASEARQRVLQVPNHHMDLAATAMRKAHIHGTVTNMAGTRRRSV